MKTKRNSNNKHLYKGYTLNTSGMSTIGILHSILGLSASGGAWDCCPDCCGWSWATCSCNDLIKDHICSSLSVIGFSLGFRRSVGLFPKKTVGVTPKPTALTRPEYNGRPSASSSTSSVGLSPEACCVSWVCNKTIISRCRKYILYPI